jgi:hypothetical protein
VETITSFDGLAAYNFTWLLAHGKAVYSQRIDQGRWAVVATDREDAEFYELGGRVVGGAWIGCAA